eukprot:273698-Amphidinium_carterae.1
MQKTSIDGKRLASSLGLCYLRTELPNKCDLHKIHGPNGNALSLTVPSGQLQAQATLPCCLKPLAAAPPPTVVARQGKLLPSASQFGEASPPRQVSDL